jgi:hypothetical protein
METYSGNVETTATFGHQGGEVYGFTRGEGSIGIAVIIAVGLFGLWWSFHTPEPRYHAGACIQLKASETWESKHRIEMVGKRSYLVRTTPETVLRPTVGGTMPFNEAHSEYEEVPCPQPTKGAK